MTKDSLSIHNKKYGVLFPGCGIKFLGSELEILSTYNYDIDTLLNRAEKVCDIDKSAFRHCKTGEFTDELQSQFATYIYSCAISDILVDLGIISVRCAGYSMGIYAALYHTGTISFEDGIRLIEHAYNCIRRIAGIQEYAVAVIIGLTFDALVGIIKKNRVPVEIINENNEISYVVTGRDSDVCALMGFSSAEGAIRTVKLPLSVPYHSVISRAAVQEFSMIFSDICISPPMSGVVSCINQNTMNTVHEIKEALSDNICNAISWLKTMEKMISEGIDSFIECGPGESLTKICKFIDGNYSVKNIAQIQKLCNVCKIKNR